MRVVALILVVVSAVSAGAQSLGEVARKEAERRKTVKTPGKTYTNDQLKSDGRDGSPATAPSTPADSATAPAARRPRATGAPAPLAAKAGAGREPERTGRRPAPADVKDEAYWRARLQPEREALSRAQIFCGRPAEPHQRSLDGFHGHGRPGSAGRGWRRPPEVARRAPAGEEGNPAAHQGVTDIQEEGRRAGVPAGWCPLVAASMRVRTPVLLVEDKDSLRTMLRLALEAQGHGVVEARDEPEAIAGDAPDAVPRSS